MKVSSKVLALSMCVLCFTTQLKAQIKMPQASSTQTLTQDFGLGKISVTYSRPNVRGRVIFGGLESYGKVWRTGANGATIINFSEDVTIEGKLVPAGEYGLFTIPGKTEWTVIISKGAKQWGAYAYKEADDLVRLKVKPTTLKDKLETFTIQFVNVYQTTAQLQISWENTLVSLNLTTDIDAKVMASIDEAMKGEKKPYFVAAQYYFSNGKDLGKALEWMNAAQAADNQKSPWINLWKGRVQLKMGDKKGAAATAEAGVKIAQEIKNDEYIRLNSALLAEANK